MQAVENFKKECTPTAPPPPKKKKKGKEKERGKKENK